MTAGAVPFPTIPTNTYLWYKLVASKIPRNEQNTKEKIQIIDERPIIKDFIPQTPVVVKDVIDTTTKTTPILLLHQPLRRNKFFFLTYYSLK